MLREVPVPQLGDHQLLIRVHACGVCRTDLHVLQGELAHPKLPLIPGHQIVGAIAGVGRAVQGVQMGQRVGVPWLASSCGTCRFCLDGLENLCDLAQYTGYTVDGGFAEYCVADAQFAYALPDKYDDVQAAPLLCAGLIGYRAYSMVPHATRLGLYGFGASAHLIAQLALSQGREVHAFTRKGDETTQQFALSLGVHAAHDSDHLPTPPLDAALIFAPAGDLVPVALRAVRKAGVVLCAGIHMSDIPQFPYSLLWEERVLRSVANLTRHNAKEFLAIAPSVPIRPHVTSYPLEKANEALRDLASGAFRGGAVLKI